MKSSLKSIIILVLILVVNSCENKSKTLLESWSVGTSSGLFTEFSQKEFDEFKSNGIDCLELNSGILQEKSDQERELWCNDFKEKADKADLKVWSVHLPYSRMLDLSVTDEETRNNMIHECVKIISLCKRLKPDKYIIHPSSEPIEDSIRTARIENSIASLKILNEEVKKQNAQLVVECLPRTCLGNTSEELLQIVNSVGNGIGVCFDSNHLLKEKPEEFVAKTGHLITTVHISDYDGLDEKHWLPGKGVINWTNVVSELVKSDYQGPFMFEVSARNNPGVTTKDLVSSWQQIKSNYYKTIIR